MTRDEAVSKVRCSKIHGADAAWQFVEDLKALGVLKLDEPKSFQDRMAEVFRAEGYAFLSTPDFLSSLDAAGLKIVEK